MTRDTDWNTVYPAYNANTLHLEGVISPETLHLFPFPEWVSPNQRDKLRAWIKLHKTTWVCPGHPVMDMLKDCGFTRDLEAFKVDGWYRVDNGLFNRCVEVIRDTLQKNWANPCNSKPTLHSSLTNQ